MEKLKLIQTEIKNLPSDEFVFLKNWINKLDYTQWDQQIEEDCNTGKLDFLIEEALAQKEKNELKQF